MHFVLAFPLVFSACGQKGSLYLPTEPAAQKRATLPQTVLPVSGSAQAPVFQEKILSTSEIPSPPKP